MIIRLESNNVENTVKKLEKRKIKIIDKHGKEVIIEYTSYGNVEDIKDWLEVTDFQIDRHEAFRNGLDEGRKLDLVK